MNNFASRHIGIKDYEIDSMLTEIGVQTLEELISGTIPESIYYGNELQVGHALSEQRVLAAAKNIAAKNKLFTNFLGQGYYGTWTPSVVKRNILENPSWYTAYTPYQAEISQGRLEMLINFQQMIIDLTGLDFSNASLLDEATACSEAVNMAHNFAKNKKSIFLAHEALHPQTLTILQTRSDALGTQLVVCSLEEMQEHITTNDDVFAIVTQPFATNGSFIDYSALNTLAAEQNITTIGCFDVLALTLCKSASEMHYDIAVGNTQRFGVPLGFGGPHAAFLATKEAFKRLIPGRLIGVSKDKNDNIAFRMSMQTREQHIRRDKATSNICTAQVLLAIMAVSYAIHHGKEGVRAIAQSVYNKAHSLGELLVAKYALVSTQYFDTISIRTPNAPELWQRALDNEINIRLLDEQTLTIAIDETTSKHDILNLLQTLDINDEYVIKDHQIPSELARETDLLTHPIFSEYTSETELMRYLKRLEDKDIALNHSMISLGSCTMKLNAATEMIAIAQEGFSNLHPYVPMNQAQGYQQLCGDLVKYLSNITGYDSISLQPNAGSQGEFAGLLAIKRYHEANGDIRDVCLIPSSAHGTNPASASMVGMHIVIIKCDTYGNVDVADLEEKAIQYSERLAALMVTYPSTHGVFEAEITRICDIIHAHGGQVYVDGANLNALVGVTKMGKFGADVSHLNLHKTFAIPHGGGGPGVGPIGVRKHLTPFLPGNPLEQHSGAVSAANFGSASILPISWSYIKLLGDDGLEKATKIAILNANYIAKKLSTAYTILYTNSHNLVAHECIIDIRPIKEQHGITEEDIAKRLMDYGFHAPTMSFPVAGTLMIEPTESESKKEIDRFIEAMLCIHAEIMQVANAEVDAQDNVLKQAPHTAKEIINWEHSYSMQKAYYPVKGLEDNKFFPSVNRIDNVYGDRNLFCSCPDISSFE